ncbi:MAG: SDR family NAD(P)-dependent oxidoreductase [Ilumatobacteraceae bacterium]
MKDVAGASVVITGGGSGIGEAAARWFAAHGAKVTISGRRADKVTAVAASLGSTCCPVVGDVTSGADSTALVGHAPPERS